MKYPLAEKFKAPQGEGVYTGTPMAFVRLVGCSVGQKVCHHCDTDFTRMNPDLGGGLMDAESILNWAADGGYEHICLTGGEPLDRDLTEIILAAQKREIQVHVETSGTVIPLWLYKWHEDMAMPWNLWITVSPKPGFTSEMIVIADEIKVIIGGLGDGPGWPTIDDAVEWQRTLQKDVFIQPRNEIYDVNMVNLQEVLRLLHEHPRLRLSVQLHKFIRTR